MLSCNSAGGAIEMQAETLNCPNCGAAISSDSPQCQYCESKLATIVCASCFGMMFIGSRHCPHCGAAAAIAGASPLASLKCPRCKVGMSSISIGGEAMRECEQCGGIWLEVAPFERICANREEQSAILGGASVGPQLPRHSVSETVRYVPCPQCGQLMNRINFARCSGVVVDVCRGHGTWFDRDELREIVEFIRAGGLELSRQKEKREIEFERQQLKQDKIAAVTRNAAHAFLEPDEDRLVGISATHELLRFVIR
jgi:Zn-finger nucleic acid-binding protein